MTSIDDLSRDELFQREIAWLDTENERLRAALAEIAGLTHATATWGRGIASRALAPQTTSPAHHATPQAGEEP